jgi:hypothetical protein
VILDDDKILSLNPEAALVSTSTTDDADPALGPSQPLHLTRDEAWLNFEGSSFVDAVLPLFELPEQNGLASAPIHDQPQSCQHSPRTPGNQINLHENDGSKQSPPGEPALYSLLATLSEDSEERGETVSELGIDLALAFEEQEKSWASESPHPSYLFC